MRLTRTLPQSGRNDLVVNRRSVLGDFAALGLEKYHPKPEGDR